MSCAAVAPETEPSAEPVLRLRPRRPWLPRSPEGGSACGWYESSRELSRGASVREVDLNEWLLAG